MHRDLLLSQLQSYKTQYIKKNEPKEVKIADQIIEFINNNTDCFHRSNTKGHITGSALLLNNTEDKALLMLHKKINKWFQLGGHADGESNILKVAIKEAQEESGILGIESICNEIIDVDIHLIDKGTDIPHYHFDVRFLLKVTSDENFVINRESLDLRWMNLDEVKDLSLESSLLRLMKKGFNYSTSCSCIK